MELHELDALLASAKQPETTVRLCLRGDLQAEWEQLDRQLSDARAQPSVTLASSARSELAGKVQALEAEMAAATITVRLRALRRGPWRELVESHPPRKDNEGDRVLGVNQASFFDALIGGCLVEPKLDADRVSALLGELTDAQFNKLADAAWGLNRRDVDVPFSQTASRIAKSSGETQRRLPDSVSASNGSQGGSRKKSPNTSTKKAG